MGSFLPEEQEFTLEEQIKVLADEELLDFWEEAHFFNKAIEGEDSVLSSKINYEVLILKELKIRTCKRVIRK